MQKRLQEQAFSANSGRQDLNLRPLDPQSSVLNQAELRPGFFGPNGQLYPTRELVTRRTESSGPWRQENSRALGPGQQRAAERPVSSHQLLQIVGRDRLAEE